MKWFLSLLFLGTALWGADGPRVFFSRDFPGAQPPYVQIVVARDGAAEYRESVDDPDEYPVEFRLRPYEVDSVFELAEKLDRFSRPLESNLKVASMGMKTFRWENGNVRQEQTFNFSKEMDARILADWFSRMAEAAQHYINLERSVQFDKLGVNQVLLQMQVMVEKDRLVAGDQFLPLLDKVANGESYLNMARKRAAKLAAHIRKTGGSNQ